MTLRPTRRGVAVALVAVVAAVLGWRFGGRTLNAVVVPAVALLAVAAVGVGRVGRPQFSRDVPEFAVDGEDLNVTVAVETARPAAATVVDALPEGVSGDARVETTSDGREATYGVTVSRGVHAIGPPTIAIADAFGLWRRTVTGSETSEVVVAPRSRPIGAPAALVEGEELPTGRDEFERVREYERGDALRDINWKASAKRDGDYMVTVFGGNDVTGQTTVGVASPSGDRAADAAAEAAASVVTALLDAGVEVGLTAGEAHRDPNRGSDHRRALLAALAAFDGGEIEERTTVSVVADRGGGVTVETPTGRWRFEELTGDAPAGRAVA